MDAMNFVELSKGAAAELEFQLILEQAPKITRTAKTYEMIQNALALRGPLRPGERPLLTRG